MQARMGGVVSDADVSVDVVRDLARPMAERALLALQIHPRQPAEVDRFVDILQRCTLAEEQRTVLIDKLISDQANATLIADATARMFPDLDQAGRNELIAALGRVHAALGQAVSQASGTPQQQAESMLAEAVDTHLESTSINEQVSGKAVVALSTQLLLALRWEEEEEEEEEDWFLETDL